MIEYKGMCQRCRGEYPFYRKAKMYPSVHDRKYCDACRQWIRSQNKNGVKRTEPRYVTNDGYVNIKIDGTYVSEHRHVMEQVIGRKLLKGENVHHLDGDRANNEASNLELWLMPQVAGIRAKDLMCPHCNKPYSSV